MRLRKIKIIFKHLMIKIILCLIFLYVIVAIIISKVSQHEAIGNKSLTYVVVHLDLKGAPPKLEYLEYLLPVMKKYGANGILIEYEDMFPYKGKLVNLSAVNCYKKQDLTRFISTAVKEGFEVIPLIQTFGHLEYALKLEEFKQLREDPQYPDSICPSRAKGDKLIVNMLIQIIQFHQSIHPLNYIHIGSDEVFHINKCRLCKNRKLKAENLFLLHVVKISSIVKNLHPNITILMWDDMLRNIDEKFWKSHHLRNYVEPVYWDYKKTLQLGAYKNIHRYHKYFKDNVWIASAFKGADGIAQIMPNLTARYENHFSWMKFMKNFSQYQHVKFKGIFLTGWSRYSHFAPLCELLPVSIPSLMLCLLIVNEYNTRKSPEALTALQGDGSQFYNKFIEKPFHKILNCSHHLHQPLQNIDLSKCSFNEHNVYNAMEVVKYLGNNTHTCLKSLDCDLVDYYIGKGLISPVLVSKYSKLYKICYKYMISTKTNLERCLNPYYDKRVISEFTMSRLASDLKYLNDTIFSLEKYSKRKAWERRV